MVTWLSEISVFTEDNVMHNKSRGASITSLTMATANPLIAPSPLRDVINPQFYQNNFPAEVYVKNELGIKLDKGKFYSLPPNTDGLSFLH